MLPKKKKKKSSAVLALFGRVSLEALIAGRRFVLNCLHLLLNILKFAC